MDTYYVFLYIRHTIVYILFVFVVSVHWLFLQQPTFTLLIIKLESNLGLPDSFICRKGMIYSMFIQIMMFLLLVELRIISLSAVSQA